MIRLATEEDIEFLADHDEHLTRAAISGKIRRMEVYIVEQSATPVGWARYNLFCDTIPFLTSLHILDGHRRRGLGTALVLFWEERMRERGFTHCLTSTQADEQAQFFCRKIGYSDSGSMLLPEQAATEIILTKHLISTQE